MSPGDAPPLRTPPRGDEHALQRAAVDSLTGYLLENLLPEWALEAYADLRGDLLQPMQR